MYYLVGNRCNRLFVFYIVVLMTAAIIGTWVAHHVLRVASLFLIIGVSSLSSVLNTYAFPDVFEHVGNSSELRIKLNGWWHVDLSQVLILELRMGKVVHVVMDATKFRSGIDPCAMSWHVW